MRAYRWLVALVFMAGGLHAQTVGSLASSACPLGGCAQGGTGTVTTTSTLVSGRVALSSGAASLTDDAGCTWTGTGSSFVGTFGGGLIVGSEAALFNTYKGANSDGLNLFIGVGGQSSVGAVGETHKGSRNTFLGIGAGTSNTTGYYNTFSGMQAGTSNTTGYYNTFNGMLAGYANTTGYANTFSGTQAGYANTTGTYNTFSGTLAGYANTTGTYNTFNGMQAGYANTDGVQNTFLGTQAGYSNTTGPNNTFVGQVAGFSNITGSANTWIGRAAGYTATGSGNVGLGYSAGRYETASNAFYVNNVDQVNTAGDKAYSLLYGTFAGTAGTTTGNMLRVNGAFETTGTGTFGTSVVTPTLDAGGTSYLTLSSRDGGGGSVNLSGKIFLPLLANLQDLGTSSTPWRLGYFGTSLISPLLVSGPGKTGTNVAGTNNTIQAEPGTGSATGSSLIFQTPTATTSGTTAQTQTTRLTIGETISSFATRIQGLADLALQARGVAVLSDTNVVGGYHAFGVGYGSVTDGAFASRAHLFTNDIGSTVNGAITGPNDSGVTALTESSATGFATLTYGASEAVSAEFLVRIKANDATDFQSLTSRVRVSSVRKATGNTISTVSVIGTDLLAESAGGSTLSCTYTVTEGAGAVTVLANCASSLTQTTLNASFVAETVGNVRVDQL